MDRQLSKLLHWKWTQKFQYEFGSSKGMLTLHKCSSQVSLVCLPSLSLCSIGPTRLITTLSTSIALDSITVYFSLRKKRRRQIECCMKFQTKAMKWCGPSDSRLLGTAIEEVANYICFGLEANLPTTSKESWESESLLERMHLTVLMMPSWKRWDACSPLQFVCLPALIYSRKNGAPIKVGDENLAIMEWRVERRSWAYHFATIHLTITLFEEVGTKQSENII